MAATGWKLRPCAGLLAAVTLVLAGTGCAIVRDPYRSEPVVATDATTGDPLTEAVVIVVRERTAWHPWRDPCTAPMRVVEIQRAAMLSAEHPSIDVEWGYGAAGCFFLLMHEYFGSYAIFSPGYDVGVHLLGRDHACVAADGHLKPIPVETGSDAYPSTPGFSAILAADDFWTVLWNYYKWGWYRRETAVACQAMVHVADVKEAAMATPRWPRTQQNILDWCRSVADDWTDKAP